MDLLKSFAHPDEVMALLRFKLGGYSKTMPKNDYAKMSKTLQKCYDYLNQTSRSFAAVIQALEGDLRHAVCIFYLVLRALDTVEDDMTIPLKKKVPMLINFHKNLYDINWNFTESKEKDRMVLVDFPVISQEFLALGRQYQVVIADITKRMGKGMTVFLERGVDTTEEWNEYCHYVAGLVGIGLSKLFSASGTEDRIVGQDEKLANNMGLFLQKTNIIRDYLEDSVDGRAWWPKATWGKYASKLSDLAKPEKREDAVCCLNELITNTLELIPDLVKYMSRIKNQKIFNFCAIPQVMAIATLERCYNNPGVFTGVVKIRKGEAVRMMMEATSMDNVKAIFVHFLNQIRKRIPNETAVSQRTRLACSTALERTQTTQAYTTVSIYPPLYVSCAMLMSAIVWKYWANISTIYAYSSGNTEERPIE